MPDPCEYGSLPMSCAVDIMMFLIESGSGSSPDSRIPSIRTAAAPATTGAAMLVPPKSENGSASDSRSSLSTLDGTNE